MLDQIYRRTLLVVWPRSQALVHAKRAGLTALLALLKLRVDEAAALHKRSNTSSSSHSVQQDPDQQDDAAGGDATSKGADQGPGQQQQQQPGGRGQGAGTAAAAAAPGEITTTATTTSNKSSSKLQQASADALAALKACVKQLAAWVKDSSAKHWQVERNSTGAAAALEQGVRLVQLGVQGAAEAVHKLLAALAASSQCLLDDADLVTALAAAAEALGPRAVSQPLQQLIKTNMADQSQHCVELISRVAGNAELQQQLVSAALSALPGAAVDPLLTLAAVVTDLPALQQQVVDKVAAAVAGDTTAGIAAEVAPLLSRLDDAPQLQQQLAAASAGVMCAAGPLQHIERCLEVLELQHVAQEVKQVVVSAVAAALQGGSSSWQVSQVLRLLEVLGDEPELQQLLQTQVAASLFDNTAHSVKVLGEQTNGSILELSDMLLGSKELREQYYSSFTAAVLQRSDRFALLQQLLETDALQAAAATRERAVSDVCSFLQSSSSSVWQVEDALELQEALSDAPPLQELLTTAIAESVFTHSELLAQQSDASMLSLSELLLEKPQLQAA